MFKNFSDEVVSYDRTLGFVKMRPNYGASSCFIQSSDLIRANVGYNSVTECSFQSMQFLPTDGNVYRIDDKIVTHWEFPDFFTSDLNESYMNELYIEVHGRKISLGSNPSIRANYILDKSDGHPYMMFSVYAGAWYSFAHYLRKVIFLGKGYRVGHVEVVANKKQSQPNQFVSQYDPKSGFITGEIFFESAWRPVSKKEARSFPNMTYGHSEGIIVEVMGTEYRLKNKKTHDLMVTFKDRQCIVLETSDQLVKKKYMLPEFPVSLGDIVECCNGEVTRIRADKSVAETSAAYSRIENSISCAQFMNKIRREVTGEEIERLDIDTKVIFDNNLYNDLLNRNEIIGIVSKYFNYRPRDIIRTVLAMGGLCNSGVFSFPKNLLNYSEFVRIHKDPKISLVFLEMVHEIPVFEMGDDDRFNFIDASVDDLIEEEISPVNYDMDAVFDGAIEVLSTIMPGMDTVHEVGCDFLETVQCYKCLVDNAKQYVMFRITEVSGTQQEICQLTTDLDVKAKKVLQRFHRPGKSISRTVKWMNVKKKKLKGPVKNLRNCKSRPPDKKVKFDFQDGDFDLGECGDFDSHMSSTGRDLSDVLSSIQGVPDRLNPGKLDGDGRGIDK